MHGSLARIISGCIFLSSDLSSSSPLFPYRSRNARIMLSWIGLHVAFAAKERSLACLDINLDRHAQCRAEVWNVDCLGSVELDADDVDVSWSNLCDFLSWADVSARSSPRFCDGRGHMPYPDHHAVTLTVVDARRRMQRAKNKFTLHSSCRRMATSLASAGYQAQELFFHSKKLIVNPSSTSRGHAARRLVELGLKAKVK